MGSIALNFSIKCRFEIASRLAAFLGRGVARLSYISTDELPRVFMRPMRTFDPEVQPPPILRVYKHFKKYLNDYDIGQSAKSGGEITLRTEQATVYVKKWTRKCNAAWRIVEYGQPPIVRHDEREAIALAEKILGLSK